MKSPRTTYEFRIDPIGLETARHLTWDCNAEDFVKMARMCFGLPIDGTPPMWHFLEIMQIIADQENAPDR